MMKKILFFPLLLLSAGLLALTPATAQVSWTPAQQEVWKVETTVGDLFQSNFQGALAYFDKDFQNWAEGSPVPVPRDSWASIVRYHLSQGDKLAHLTAVPLDIWVEGNDAYVDYYTMIVFQDKAGKKIPVTDCNLDVLHKKDDRWLIVASMTMDGPGESKGSK
jgi:hypothetical protein